METKIKKHEAEDIGVTMYTHTEDVEKRLLRGRALLDTDGKKLLFSENEPRGPRSREIVRGEHSRLVRRPDGRYTLTFSCLDAGEKNLREVLLAELRDAYRTMAADNKKEQKKGKEEKDEKD